MKWRLLAGVLLAVLLTGWPGRAETQTTPAPAPTAQAAPAEPPLSAEDKKDAELGKKAAAAIEKELKVIESYSTANLLQIVDRLRPVTEKPYQKYTLKVVDEKAINAFSLPGGYIYFTKGLLRAVESEDELAAVTAHEMAHICNNHSRQMMSRDTKYNKIFGGLVMAAVLAAKNGVDPGAVATFASVVKTNTMNQWGQDAEYEADREAVRYLAASKVYNPVAVLTVVEGLAKMDKSGPEHEEVTHPYAVNRVTAVQKLLLEMQVPIERPRVRKGIVATAIPVQKAGQEIGEIRLDTLLVFQPAAEMDGVSPVARAQQCADLLNPLLLQEIALVDISTMTRKGIVLIQARGETVLKITPADAAFHNLTVEQLAKQAMGAIKAAFFADNAKRAY